MNSKRLFPSIPMRIIRFRAIRTVIKCVANRKQPHRRHVDNERALPAGRGRLQQHADMPQDSTDDEYHHEDPLGVFGVITGASGAVLSSNVYDSFMAHQYVPVPSKHPAKCYIAMSEPSLLTGSGGRGAVVPNRGFQVMGNKPAPVKKQACASHPILDCLDCCLKAGSDWVYCATTCHSMGNSDPRPCNYGEWRACDNYCRGFGENNKCSVCTYDMDNLRYYYECSRMWIFPWSPVVMLG